MKLESSSSFSTITKTDKMKVYHGTVVQFDSIDVTKGNANTDFSIGFYVTKDEYQAKKWAVDTAIRIDENYQFLIDTGFRQPTMSYLKVLEFDRVGFEDKSLNCRIFETPTEDWARLILECRTDPENRTNCYHNFDILEGPLADNGIGKIVQRYKYKIITLQQALSSMVLTEYKYNHQISFHNQIAVDKYLKLLDTKIIDRREIYD